MPALLLLSCLISASFSFPRVVQEDITESLEVREDGTEDVDPSEEIDPATCDSDRCIQDSGRAMHLRTGETIQVFWLVPLIGSFGVCSVRRIVHTAQPIRFL